MQLSRRETRDSGLGIKEEEHAIGSVQVEKGNGFVTSAPRLFLDLDFGMGIKRSFLIAYVSSVGSNDRNHV